MGSKPTYFMNIQSNSINNQFSYSQYNSNGLAYLMQSFDQQFQLDQIVLEIFFFFFHFYDIKEKQLTIFFKTLKKCLLNDS